MLGSLDVEVMYGDQREMLPLVVVKGNGPSLFDRDWLHVARLKLDRKGIHLLNSLPLDGLGTLRGYKGKLYVKANAVPKFCKARPVPICNERQGGKRVKVIGASKSPGAYSVFRLGCTHCACLKEGRGYCLSVR